MVDIARCFCATRCCQWARKILYQYQHFGLINSISRSQFYTKFLCTFKAHIRIIEWIFMDFLGKDVRINISSTALMFVQTSWHEKFAALRSHIASTRVTGGETGNGTVSSIWRLKKLRGFGMSNHLVTV